MVHTLKGALPFRNATLYVHNPVGRAVILCNSVCAGLDLLELSLHYKYSVDLYGKSFPLAYYSSLSKEISFLTPIIQTAIQSYWLGNFHWLFNGEMLKLTSIKVTFIQSRIPLKDFTENSP